MSLNNSVTLDQKDINSNEEYDLGEDFTDIGNGVWDKGEDFTDKNGNKIWDRAEIFIDQDGKKGFNDGYIKFTENWIKPFGTIFLSLIKLFAIPLILVSLIKGISSISNISRLSKIGFKTLAIYITTTFIAVVIGLLLVNIFQPGKGLNPDEYNSMYSQHVNLTQDLAEDTKDRGPLQPLVDMFPENSSAHRVKCSYCHF